MEKQCKKCNETKTFEEFHKNKNTRDGLGKWCKFCKSQWSKKKREENKINRKARVEMIKCSSCKVKKKITEFHKNACTSTGYNGLCKECRSKNVKEKINEYRNRETIDYPETKKCSKCGNVKKFTDFSISRCTKQGLISYCKRCESNRQKLYGLKQKTRPVKIKNKMKKCPGCDNELHSNFFHLDRTRPDFLTTYCVNCTKQKHNEYKQYIREIKKEKGGKCIKCSFDNINALEFHHRDMKEKINNVIKIKETNKLLKEIDKCDLLCVICHRIESHLQRKDMYSLEKISDCQKRVERNVNYTNKVKLKNNKCALCDKKVVKGNEFCFDFDHLNKEEKYKNVSDMCMNKFSIKRIQDEINKCRLLCANCHRLFTIDS